MDVAVQFQNVSFAYPKREFGVVDQQLVTVEHEDQVTQVLNSVTVDLPSKMMAVVGQNGIGKSTLLLLAGARLFPQSGVVSIFGRPSSDFVDAALDPGLEHERNRYVSFIYQNMEFETEDTVGNLMETVYEQGFHEEHNPGFLEDIRRELELDSFLHLKTQQLAKGQLQRAIIGFSLLYGSKIIMMDEPVFALEEPQKERAFDFLLSVSEQRSIPIYFSVHNLELSQKYSQYLLLFSRTGSFKVGPTAKLYTRENIEEAYQIPMSMLHKREFLYREMLNKSSIPPQT